MADNLEITCPCCATVLVVEPASGEILAERRPKVDAEKTFDDAFREVRSASSKREQAFTKALDRTRKLDDLLEKKFEEARKKAEDEPSKPVNPMDLD